MSRHSVYLLADVHVDTGMDDAKKMVGKVVDRIRSMGRKPKVFVEFVPPSLSFRRTMFTEVMRRFSQNTGRKAKDILSNNLYADVVDWVNKEVSPVGGFEPLVASFLDSELFYVNYSIMEKWRDVLDRNGDISAWTFYSYRVIDSAEKLVYEIIDVVNSITSFGNVFDEMNALDLRIGQLALETYDIILKEIERYEQKGVLPDRALTDGFVLALNKGIQDNIYSYFNMRSKMFGLHILAELNNILNDDVDLICLMGSAHVIETMKTVNEFSVLLSMEGKVDFYIINASMFAQMFPLPEVDVLYEQIGKGIVDLKETPDELIE